MSKVVEESATRHKQLAFGAHGRGLERSALGVTNEVLGRGVAMPVTVLKSMHEYVAALLELEETPDGVVALVSSYVSSVYFPQRAIEGFFLGFTPPDHTSCELLLRRCEAACAGRRVHPRREIYESEAFIALLSQCLPHAQERHYRVRPSDLVSTLESILHAMASHPQSEIAITSEVLPLVYVLSADERALIDVRANYTYQGIQGLLISDSAAYADLRHEFERLWASPLTISDQSEVRSLISGSLSDWQESRSVNLSAWPRMKISDREE